MNNTEIALELVSMLTALIITTIIIIKIINKGEKKEKREKKQTHKQKTEREKLIDRLTDYEIKRLPHLSRKEARKTALERWERDRR